MTLANNILGALSQLAPASQSTTVSRSSSTSDDFNAVLAALLGTEAPAATSPTSVTNPSILGAEKAGVDLAALQSALDQTVTADPSVPVSEAPTLEEIVANMLDLLKKLEQQLKGDAPLDADLVAQINAGLSALLDGKTPPPAPMPAGGQDTKLSGLAQLMTETAEKLATLQPDLAQKVDALAQKLTAAAKTAEAPPPEVTSNIATATKSKEQLEKAGPSLQQPREGDLIAALENKTKAVTGGANNGANTTTDPNAPKLATGEARATANAEARQGLNGAQPNVTANPPANPGQADNFFLAQTVAQPTAAVDGLSAVKPMTAAYQSPVQNLNMPHIAVEFVRQMQGGASRFQIRLDPPEMGRIDVKLDMDNAGNVNARLTVERPDTLDLLQRDARALERALSQAGLDTGRTNLEFSLKQNPFARQDGQSDNPFAGDNPSAKNNTDTDDAISEMAQTLIYRGGASPGGINMLA